MPPDDAITDIQVVEPLAMSRTGESVSLWIQDLGNISPIWVKRTETIENVTDAGGTLRTAYAWRKQQMGPGGVWQDSDDLVSGFTNESNPRQEPLFSAQANSSLPFGEVIRIYPGVRDTQSDPTLNHGLEWWFGQPSRDVYETLRIQAGATTSLGYKAYVQKWDIGSLAWIDKDTNEVRVSDRDGGLAGYETGQLIHNALFLGHDITADKDYYEAAEGIAYGIGGVGHRGLISSTDQIMGAGYKMADCLALTYWGNHIPIGHGSGGAGALIGGDQLTFLLEDTSGWATPLAGNSLNTLVARGLLAKTNDATATRASGIGAPATSGPFSVVIHGGAFSNTYTGVSRTTSSIYLGFGTGSAINFVEHSGGTFPGSLQPYTSFVEADGGMYAVEFGISQGPGITYRGESGSFYGGTFSGGILIIGSSTVPGSVLTGTVDGGTW